MEFQSGRHIHQKRFKNNGRLFEPKSWNENEVAYKIGKLLGEKNWHIGINDKQNEGQFVFESDGTPISYSPKWYADYGAKGTTMNCILFAIGNSVSTARWHDYTCSSAYGSICEQNA